MTTKTLAFGKVKDSPPLAGGGRFTYAHINKGVFGAMKVASHRTLNWNNIERWLQNVLILQDSLKDYDDNHLHDHRTCTSNKIPPEIGTESNESAFKAHKNDEAAGVVLELP
jgi:hypothetical protein